MRKSRFTEEQQIIKVLREQDAAGSRSRAPSLH